MDFCPTSFVTPEPELACSVAQPALKHLERWNTVEQHADHAPTMYLCPILPLLSSSVAQPAFSMLMTRQATV